MSEKQQLTEYRRNFVQQNGWRLTPKMRLLEEKFGKYMFVPLDLPPIRPNDPEKFKTWYMSHAKQVLKKKADVAGPPQYGGKTFLSINSPKFRDPIWENNTRYDLFIHFPEIKQAMRALPFREVPQYMIWSSQRIVSPHRDQGPWVDLPISFRIMLYDENPGPTLYLKKHVPDQVTYAMSFKLPRLDETTTFAWNNVRTKHGSSFDPAYTKILMILGQACPDLDQYEDLLTRSVEKYKESVFLDDAPLSSYINT